MGAYCRALIFHPVVPTFTSTTIHQIPKKSYHRSNPTASTQTTSGSTSTSRRALLFSVPISTTSLLLLPSTSSTYSHAAAVPDLLFDPLSREEKDASASVSRRVSKAIELLDKGREFQAQGDFPQALHYFTQVVKDYNDFAFSDYARVGRAFALYEVGDREEAITEMEDVSISLKGYPGISIGHKVKRKESKGRKTNLGPQLMGFSLIVGPFFAEVHAALAAALYVDKHAPLLAENQFAIATLLDPHYTDLTYVRDMKHWPPSLVSSLKNFITLS